MSGLLETYNREIRIGDLDLQIYFVKGLIEFLEEEGTAYKDAQRSHRAALSKLETLEEKREKLNNFPFYQNDN